MTTRRCPSCKTPVENNVSTSGECLSCGHDLVATAPAPAWQPPGVDLRKVAKRQRTLLWFVLALVVLNVLSVVNPVVAPAARPWATGGQFVLMIAVQLAALITIVQLLSALGVHVAWCIVCGLIMLAPCINILLLLAINQRATSALTRAGLKVGFLGVSAEQVERVLSANRCTTCGYLLVGNVSGTCPECGASLAADQLS